MSTLSSSFLLLSKRSFTIGKVSPQYKFSPSFHYQKRCLCTDNSNNDGNSKKDDKVSQKDTRSSTSTKGSKFKERVKQDVDTVAAAKKKLFNLLEGMAESSGNKNEVSSNLKLAKPVKKPILSKQKIQKAEVERRMLEKYPHLKIEKAAKKVAYSIDGDQAKTLSELNEKLRKMNLIPSPPQSSADVKDDTVLSQETEGNLMSSVKKVASTVTDGTPPRMSKFAQRLGRLSAEGKFSDLPERPINAMLKGMIVEKQIQQRKSKGFFERTSTEVPPSRQRSRINIFDSPPLDVFKLEVTTTDFKKTVWQSLEEKELKLLIQYAPTNGFEEMMMWTEQGKHWTFPVDNQRDLAGEENVSFHEHVFLEKHLHGFSKKYNIPHFMELVTVGLSKNPYISVERKIQTINWFRDYFKEKEQLKVIGS